MIKEPLQQKLKYDTLQMEIRGTIRFKRYKFLKLQPNSFSFITASPRADNSVLLNHVALEQTEGG